jgi:7-cyano-7-deazaguanine reductase
MKYKNSEKSQGAGKTDKATKTGKMRKAEKVEKIEKNEKVVKNVKVVKNENTGKFKTIIPTAYNNPDEKLYGETIIEENELERFPNRTLVRKYDIEFTCPEFTCICPRSGFPDFATILINYVPDKWCVELKSLKFYINGFRNEKVFHEDVTNQILDDLVELLDPWEMEVIGDFAVRGNIRTVIRSKHVKKTAKKRK